MKIDKTIPLHIRKLKARRLKGEGYNCAQCMFMAFSDLHGLDDEKAAALSCGLGGGVGGLRNVCGTISTIASLLGMSGYNSPADKKYIYSAVQECSSLFCEKNGSIICEELKTGSALRKPCMDYIEDAIGILHEKLNRED